MKRRNPHEEVEKAAREFVSGVIDRMTWIFAGKYPEPPDWEKPLVADMLKFAMKGDDKALEWLKQRFPPSAGLQ